jgi:hypothetical protein
MIMLMQYKSTIAIAINAKPRNVCFILHLHLCYTPVNPNCQAALLASSAGFLYNSGMDRENKVALIEAARSIGLPEDQYSALCGLIFGGLEGRFKAATLEEYASRLLTNAIVCRGTGLAGFEERLANVIQHYHEVIDAAGNHRRTLLRHR